MAETSPDDVRVSVIVPVYQAADHLDECVGSLAVQTHRALEIVLVDDGSTDGSGHLCDEWARRDPRVLVIHASNGGLSVARNRGLDRSTGAFVSFVDADDVVSPTYVATLLDAALSLQADLVIAGLVPFTEPGDPPAFRPGRVASQESPHVALARIVTSGIGFASCGKLIDARLFSDLRFKPHSDFEDLELLPRLMGRSSTVVVSDAAEYGYRQHEGSLMDGHRKLLRPTILRVLSSNIQYTCATETDVQRRRELVVGYVLHAIKTLEAASPATTQRAPGYDLEYRRFLASHLSVLLRSPQISALYKTGALVSLASPGLFVRFIRVARRVKATGAPGLHRRSRHTTEPASPPSSAQTG